MAGKFTVIIPTFDHGPTLKYSIDSVLKQSYQDFEIYVIGDGAPDITREVMSKLVKQDKRIHYIDRPKGPRNGEIYRDDVIRSHESDFVAYLSDDDMWLPNHLDIMSKFLQRADFAHTLHVNVFPDSNLMTQVVFLDLEEDIHEMKTNGNYGFGLSFGAHRRDFYLQLPYGWRTTPKGTNTDLYMWRQFVEQPGCRLVSIGVPTGIHYSSADRKTWEMSRRLDELKDWQERLSTHQGREEFLYRVQQAANDTHHHYAMVDRQKIRQQNEYISKLDQEIRQIKASRWWRLRNFLVRFR